MKLEKTNQGLIDQAIQLAKQCLNSQQERIDNYVRWRNYVYAGAADAQMPAIYNKVGPHIDRLSSMLFSPSDVRFMVEFGPHTEEDWINREVAISRLLSDEFHGADCDLCFGEGVFWALAYGTSLVKLLWHERRGLDPFLVMPHQVGVMNEYAQGLDHQEAICHVSYLTISEFRRRVSGMSGAADMVDRVRRNVVDRTQDDIDNIVHQVIIGGVTPVTQGNPSGVKGSVDVWHVMGQPMVSPEVARDLVRFIELWVIDEDTGDYTTLQYAEPDVLIEGGDRKRNIYLPGRQPFTLIQPNEQWGYFWGRSEVSDLQWLQNTLAKRLDDIAHIWQLRARPPRGLIGFTGLNDEARRAFSSPSGLIMNDNPNAKIEDLSPPLPPEAMEQVNEIIKYFDDAAGFPPIMQGQGESGVRAGMHADSLSRTASSRIRDRALKVERQCADFGELALDLRSAKDDSQYEDKAGQYLLEQMPERKVSVDSHSTSPAFTSDHRMLAFSLAKAGAITPEGLLMLVNPPMMDVLMKQLKEKEKREAELIKQYPEILTRGRSRRH